MSEERNAAPVRLGVEQAEAGLDELVQERLWNRITRGRRPPVTGLDRRLLAERDAIRAVPGRNWRQAVL